MQIIKDSINLKGLKEISGNTFGNLVKAVVDVDREWLAVDAELHSDLEALLLENGSGQKSLWGINLYPDNPRDGFIEFDSVINLRPSQGNRNRGIDDGVIREKIIEIVSKRIVR